MQAELVLRQLFIEFEIRKNKCATVIQSYVRRCITVYEYQIMLEQSRAIILQRNVRRLNAIVEFEILQDWRRITQLQAKVRSFNATILLLDLHEERNATLFLQSWLRRQSAIELLDSYRKEFEGARMLQSFVLQYNSRCLYLTYEIEEMNRKDSAAIVLQKWIRMKLSIDRFQIILSIHNVTIIQSILRMVVAQNELSYLVQRREIISAIKLQSFIRRLNDSSTLEGLEEIETVRRVKEKEEIELREREEMELQEREMTRKAVQLMQNYIRSNFAVELLNSLHLEMLERIANEEQHQQHLAEIDLAAEMNAIEFSASAKTAMSLDEYPMSLDDVEGYDQVDDALPKNQENSQAYSTKSEVEDNISRNNMNAPFGLYSGQPLPSNGLPVASVNEKMEMSEQFGTSHSNTFNTPVFNYCLSVRDEREIGDFFSQIDLPSLGIFMAQQAISLKSMLLWKDPAKKLRELGVTQAGVLWRTEEALKAERLRMISF
jgi:hypothetical protein